MQFKGTPGPWKVKHSESKTAWNVIGTQLGGKYKIAQCPYIITKSPLYTVNAKTKAEAEQEANALLISKAPELLEQLHKLAIHVLQSEGYRSLKLDVDESLMLIKSATECTE